MTLTRPRISTFHIKFVSKSIRWVAVHIGGCSFKRGTWIFEAITATAFWPPGMGETEYRSVDYAVRRGAVVAQEEGLPLIGAFPKGPRDA